MKGKIIYLSSAEASSFLLPRHYSGRKPNISKAFGLMHKGDLKCVLTFGKPASHTLCEGICGKENKHHVYELNRVCRLDDWDEPLSAFVAGCLRRVKSLNWIIVSYADTAMNHCGYIYQACNFIYTGATKKRTEQYTTGNKHSRHSKTIEQNGIRKVRSSKHRYVYFCTKKKHLLQEWKKSLNYSQQPYPKTINKNYYLGNFLQPELVDSTVK